MKKAIQEALDALIEAVGSYDPTENDDINCVVTEGLMNHLQSQADSIVNSYDEDWVYEAAHYLCDGDLSVKEQVLKIASVEFDYTPIDFIDGVIVWEPLVDRFNCQEFLETIGYFK